MRNKYSLAFLLTGLLCLSGCSGNFSALGIARDQDSRALAEDLVRQDWKLFAAFQRQDFSDRISGDFLTDKSLFLSEAEASFFRELPLDLSFTVSSVFRKDGKLGVAIKWQRRTASRENGDLTLKEGSCLIVYRYEDDQWRIYKIQGNSIFIF